MRKVQFLLQKLLHTPIISSVMAISILGLLSYFSLSEERYPVSKSIADSYNPDTEGSDEEITFHRDLRRRETHRAKPRRNIQLQQHLDRLRGVDENDWNKRLGYLYYDILDGDPTELEHLGLGLDGGDSDDQEYYEDVAEYYQSRKHIQQESRAFMKRITDSRISDGIKGGEVDISAPDQPNHSQNNELPDAYNMNKPTVPDSSGSTRPQRKIFQNEESTEETNINKIDPNSNRTSEEMSMDFRCKFTKNNCVSNSSTGFYQIPYFEIFLYSAFLDAHNPDHRYIRIFGMQNRTQQTDVQCSVYTGEGSTFQLLKVHGIFPAYSEWPTDQAIYLAYQYGYHITEDLWTKILATKTHLLKCWVEKHHSIQIPFEIVPQRRTLSNDVAVCVKSIWGNVDKYRLIEWIEFQKLLGVSSITFYRQAIDKVTEEILQYYETTGLVNVIRGDYMERLQTYIAKDPMAERIRHPDWLMEQVYLVNINDCLYQYSKTHKFVLLIDIDEFLIPSSEENLTEMISRLYNDLPLQSAYIFPTVWHFKQFGSANNNSGLNSKSYNAISSSKPTARTPTYSRAIYRHLHTQNYLRRTPIMSSQPKSIIVSGTFITANWHGPHIINNALGYKGNYAVNGEVYGILHHYRDGCKYDPNRCKEIFNKWTLDTQVSKYRDSLAESFVNTLKDLHLNYNMSISI